jgi:hypothetical protein
VTKKVVGVFVVFVRRFSSFNSKVKKINLSEPIDISYESNGYGLKFYLEDGHHRYFAAKTLKL